MEIKLHNTLSNQKETFKPIVEGRVGLYDCGPTVYDYAHVGNLRSYVFADILRRVLEYNGYNVRQVINITDVGHLVGDGDEGEDKMTKAIKREGRDLTLSSMIEIGDFYFQRFKEDLEALNIERPSEFPKASDHIGEDIEIISSLVEKGFTYKTSDGLYFDTSKFLSYGKLGNTKMSGQTEGQRIAPNNQKRNPADFALWKFNPKIGWESPWGSGFPGWHIECSGMSRKYLGQPFDIHTGGIDHIPVHHNNEIAQSEAAYGVNLANYWMHNEFLNMNNTKMAKSAGTYITLASLLENSISPLSYRYWLLTAHYRTLVNFTLEGVGAAQTALIRLMSAIRELPEGGRMNLTYSERFLGFVNDDLNTASAVALIWEILKDEKVSPADRRATILDFDRVLGLKLDGIPKISEEKIPDEITALVQAREEARLEKDWLKADALRAEIENRGFILEDTAGGARVRPQ